MRPITKTPPMPFRRGHPDRGPGAKLPWVLAILLVLLLPGIGSAVTSGDVILQGISRTERQTGVYQLPDTLVDSRTFIRRAVIVNGPVGDIWPLLMNPDRIMEMMPQIKEFEILESHLDSTVMLCKAKPKWYLKTFACTLFVACKAFEKMRWVRTGGDFKSLECSWEFLPMTNGNMLAIFSIHFELGGLIPAFLVTRATKSTLPEMMLRFRDWIAENIIPARDRVPHPKG